MDHEERARLVEVELWWSWRTAQSEKEQPQHSITHGKLLLPSTSQRGQDSTCYYDVRTASIKRDLEGARSGFTYRKGDGNGKTVISMEG